jgi:HPt (histidine-containing phosphotransfer) domain-containing protein
VAVTAYAMSEDRNRLLQEGFDHYLPKPIKLDDLTELLGKTENVLPKPFADTQTINLEVWNTLRNIAGTDFVKESIEDCIAESNILIAEIFEYLEKQDFDSIKKHLHTLKGSTATVGLEKFAKQTEILEKKSISMEVSKFQNDLYEWRKIWQETIASYQTLWESWQ